MGWNPLCRVQIRRALRQMQISLALIVSAAAHATRARFSYGWPQVIARSSSPGYLRLAAWPRLCAGTVITRNARCAPSPRALYPNLAIDPLACARPGRRRDRRLQFWLGRRATRRCRFRLDRSSRCNRLRDAIRQERLAIRDNRRGRRFIRRQTRVRAARRLQQGIQTKRKTRGNGAIDNQMDA